MNQVPNQEREAKRVKGGEGEGRGGRRGGEGRGKGREGEGREGRGGGRGGDASQQFSRLLWKKILQQEKVGFSFVSLDPFH